MKKKTEKPLEFINFDSVAELLEKIHAAGLTEKDYKNIEFNLNTDNCYYEGDTPSIEANLVIK